MHGRIDHWHFSPSYLILHFWLRCTAAYHFISFLTMIWSSTNENLFGSSQTMDPGLSGRTSFPLVTGYQFCLNLDMQGGVLFVDEAHFHACHCQLKEKNTPFQEESFDATTLQDCIQQHMEQQVALIICDPLKRILKADMGMAEALPSIQLGMISFQQALGLLKKRSNDSQECGHYCQVH